MHLGPVRKSFANRRRRWDPRVQSRDDGRDGGRENSGRWGRRRLICDPRDKETQLRYRVHSGNALNSPETRMTVSMEEHESQDKNFSEKLT